MTMPQGPSGLEDAAWMKEWVNKAKAPGSGASRHDISNLHNRTRAAVETYYKDNLPLSTPWSIAQNSLFQKLMGGFNDLTEFLQHLAEAIGGAGKSTLAHIAEAVTLLSNSISAAHTMIALKSAAGSNLMLSPTFVNTLVKRFSYSPDVTDGYTIERAHSGLSSWKWKQNADTNCGLVFAPAEVLDSFDVKPGEQYFVQAWIYPKATNPTSSGSIVLGGTFKDSSGTLPDLDVSDSYALSSPDVAAGQWNQISKTIPVPDGYESARFWCYASSDTAADSVFYIDDVTVREVSDARTYVDHVSTALIGEDVKSGNTKFNALSALRHTFDTLQSYNKRIANLEGSKTVGVAKGVSLNINFSDYADNATTLPTSQFSPTSYTGSSTPRLGILGGLASWATLANADCNGKVIHLTPTATDFQLLRGTMSTPPQKSAGGGTPKFHAIGRVSSDGDSYVFARAYCDGFLSYKAEMGYVLDGVESVWFSGISLTWNLDMRFVVGNGTNPRQYQLWSGNTLVKEWDETYVNGVGGTVNQSRSLLQGDWLVSRGAASGGTFTLTYDGATTSAIAYNATAATVKSALTALGKGDFFVNTAASGWYVNPPSTEVALTGSGSLTGGSLSVTQQTTVRRWGSIAQLRSGTTGPVHSGKLAAASAVDSGTPTVAGTVARMYRQSSDSEAMVGGNNITALPSSFFTKVDYESLDVDANTSDGTFKVTTAGMYAITARVKLNSALSALCHLILQVNSGSSWVSAQYGDSVYPNNSSDQSLTGHWIQYLNAGDSVRLASVRSGLTQNCFDGGSSAETYFNISALG